MAKLWTPNLFGPKKHVARELLVTLPTGERVRVTVDDSGTVKHTEHDDRLDVLVRPRSVKLKVRREGQ